MVLNIHCAKTSFIAKQRQAYSKTMTSGIPVYVLGDEVDYFIAQIRVGINILQPSQNRNCLIATCSVRIWGPHTGQQTLTLSYPSAVPMVAWNPDGKSLACVGFGGGETVRIWDATVNRPDSLHW